MQDARLAHFFQFLPFHAEGTSLHTEGFRRLLQFEEGCSLVSASRQPLHGSSREVLAILPADDAEAGGSAIGTVVLFIEVVFGHGLGLFYFRFYHNQHHTLTSFRFFPIHQILVVKNSSRYKGSSFKDI